MSMVIQNNLNALNSFNNLAKNVKGTSKASEKLASGFRINRAADDAAGLAVSEKMRAQLRGLGQAIRNANDGISLIQTAEGALEETHAMLHRLQELATQSANDTYDNTDRVQIQREAKELLTEITRIARETDFNGIRLFNGTRGVNGAVTSATTSANGILTASGGAISNGLAIAVDGGGNVRVAIQSSAGVANSTQSSFVGGNATYGTTMNLVTTNWGISTSTNGGISADITAAYSSANFLQYDSALLTSVSNNATWANNRGGITIQIGAYAAAGQRLVMNFGDMTAEGLGLNNINLMSLAGAQVALGSSGGTDISLSSGDKFVGPFEPGSIRFATNLVNSQRAQLGAWQNRLESTVNNLTASHENLTAAESAIRDTDMASEMINFTKFNILQQAAQAMLAQANQAPQAVLQLLR